MGRDGRGGESIAQSLAHQLTAQVFEDAIVEGRGDNEMYRIAEMGGFMVPGAVLAVSRLNR